jgi:hypothetical protein
MTNDVGTRAEGEDMTTTAGQTAFDAEKNGRLIGRLSPGADTKWLWWRVYLWKGEIIACVFDANGNTGAYDVIDTDNLYMYVDDVTAALAALAEK